MPDDNDALLDTAFLVAELAADRIHDDDRRERYWRQLSGKCARRAATESDQAAIRLGIPRAPRTPSAHFAEVTEVLERQAEIENRVTPVAPKPDERNDDK